MLSAQSFTRLRLLILLPILICLGGCLNALEENHPGALLTALPSQRGNTSQILMVREERSFFSTQIMVRALEWREQAWQPVFGPMKAVIGRKGFAPPGEKREGDGRTPSGVFTLPLVFGYSASAPTRMPYRQAREEDLWVDDPASPDYNHWVVRGETAAASFERLKRDDDLYKYGIVIAYNTDPVIKDHGSAIFLHLWRGPESTTAGCVALAEADVRKILAWLEPSANPVIILHPADP